MLNKCGNRQILQYSDCSSTTVWTLRCRFIQIFKQSTVLVQIVRGKIVLILVVYLEDTWVWVKIFFEHSLHVFWRMIISKTPWTIGILKDTCSTITTLHGYFFKETFRELIGASIKILLYSLYDCNYYPVVANLTAATSAISELPTGRISGIKSSKLLHAWM